MLFHVVRPQPSLPAVLPTPLGSAALVRPKAGKHQRPVPQCQAGEFQVVTHWKNGWKDADDIRG